MADQGFQIEPVNTPPNGKAIMISVAGFLLATLLIALLWFWMAGRHSISATPQHGPSGVGGMTAGDKGGKQQ